MPVRSRIAILLGVLSLATGALPLNAQRLTFKAAAGAAVPVSDAGDRRDTGPTASLSVESRLSGRWSLRLDGDWSLLDAPPAPVGREPSFQDADLQTYGVALNVVGRLFPSGTTPYLLAGVGAYRLQALGRGPNPYGTTGAVQAGLGVEGGIWRRINPFAEVRLTVPATDYGAREFSPTVYWPVLVGVQIR